jgi:hypothetical protein
MLNPTPADKMVDLEGHPYFLWDCDMTLTELQSGLQDPDPEVRAYLVGKLMRQGQARRRLHVRLSEGDPGALAAPGALPGKHPAVLDVAVRSLGSSLQ